MLDAPDKDAPASAEESDGAAVLHGLGDEELVGLINRLRLLAARKYYGSLDVDELVTKALSDTLEGVRSWDTNNSHFRNLWLIVRSIASNQLKKEERMPTCALEAEDGSGRTAPLLPAHPSPAEIYIEEEARRTLRGMIDRAVGEDRLLRKAVEFFFEREVWKPKEMAPELRVSEREIYKAKRRMRRRLEKLL